MSHGEDNDMFQTSDGLLRMKRGVMEEFNNVRCKKLKDIPKIFLANFCRGEKYDTQTDSKKSTSASIKPDPSSSSSSTDFAIPEAETDGPGSMSDMLLCHATYDGRLLFPWMDGRFWYDDIQVLCM